MRWVARVALAERFRRLTASPDAGASTAEAVLITPLLVAVLLFVVLCGRLVTVQMDLDAAASAAARAGSIARTEPAARADAARTARDTLAARGVTCPQATVTVTTGGLRPGGAVTVTVSCTVPLSDLTLLGVPGTRTVTATSTSPIDTWRGTALGFSNSAGPPPPPRRPVAQRPPDDGIGAHHALYGTQADHHRDGRYPHKPRPIPAGTASGRVAVVGAGAYRR